MASLLSRVCRQLLLASLLLLAACSSTTFFYNRLDFILPWYVDDFAELNGEQEKYLDELLAPFLHWHRAQELPRYLLILDKIESGLDRPATAASVGAVWSEFELAWLRLEGEALDWLLDLGGQLSQQQVDGFLQELWQGQGEFEDEYLGRSDEEFHEDAYDDLLDNAGDYLGRLDREQRQLLQDASRRLMRSDKVWLAERVEWLQQLGVLLERKPGWQQRIRDAIAVREKNTSPEYLRIYRNNLQVIQEVLAELLNSRSGKQDRYLRGKLSDLREDIETLIVQGRRPAPGERSNILQ